MPTRLEEQIEIVEPQVVFIRVHGVHGFHSTPALVSVGPYLADR